MKRHLRFAIVIGAFTSLPSASSAQSDQFTYAITDITREGVSWSALRRLDLNTGKFSDVLLNGNDVNQSAFDHSTKERLAEPMKDARFGNLANAVFGTGVAAIAYDKKNQRLYYTPMFISQLRYIDLRTMKVYFVSTPPIEGLTTKAADQSNIITRMVIADDEHGYALTNDARHLLRFTTGKTITVTDLGSLVDDPKNNEVSIHNSCSSYGGDMIADDEDNLYLFSNSTYVFKINTHTKVATRLGAVKGLPAGFTINGAAVDNHNRILVMSSANHQSMYTVDHSNLTASPMTGAETWKTSDLANSNILATRKSTPFVRLLPAKNEILDAGVQVFPNPVVDNRLTIQFNLAAGKYMVQLKDANGKLISFTRTRINANHQATTLTVPDGASKGFYIVHVLGEENQHIYSKKILVH